MHLGRVGIEHQRGFEFLGGVGLVVLLGKQPAGLVAGSPIRGVRLEQVGIKLVDEKTELIAQAVPAGELGRAQADGVQRVGILDVVGIVVVDQPLVVGVGFFELAGRGEQFGADPVSRHLLGVEFERGVDGRLGRGVVAPLESQAGQFGLERRRVGEFRCRSERFDGLVAIACRFLAAGDAQRGGHGVVRLEGTKRLLCFGVLAFQQQPLGRGQLVGRLGAADPGNGQRH